MNRNLVPSRPCVLIVEDDDAVRRSTELLLRSRGLDVRAHATAATALADPLTLGAVCLVADLKMPDVDGIELLQALRHRGWQGPAILISGFMTDALEEQARRIGYVEVLRKPVADNLLTTKVREVMAHAD